jgi:hypothetical protein
MLGGYMNQYYHPKWTFFFYSSFGLFVSCIGLTLSKKIDKEGLEQMKGFLTELGKTVMDVGKILK